MNSLAFTDALELLILMLTVSLVICFIRLVLGPDIPNRTVAFDAIAVHSVGILVLYAMRSGASSLVDVAIVSAVLGFLGTTMLARYLEKTGEESAQGNESERSASLE